MARLSALALALLLAAQVAITTVHAGLPVAVDPHSSGAAAAAPEEEEEEGVSDTCESSAGAVASQITGPLGGMLFFLATPSTGSSTVDHLFSDIMKKTVQIGQGRKGAASARAAAVNEMTTATHSGPESETWPSVLVDSTVCANGMMLEVRESSDYSSTLITDGADAASGADAAEKAEGGLCTEAQLGRQLNLTYRGKTHMDFDFIVRTQTDATEEKRAMIDAHGGREGFSKAMKEGRVPGRGGAHLRKGDEHFRVNHLHVEDLRQSVHTITMIRSPTTWVRSMKTRFYGSKPAVGRSGTMTDQQLGEWVRSVHWLWNTQVRFLAGNFTRFGSEVLGSGPDDPATGKSEADLARPSREEALVWSAGESGTQLLETAKRRLESMAWFGVLEDLQTSVAVAEATFCWRHEPELMNQRLGRPHSAMYRKKPPAGYLDDPVRKAEKDDLDAALSEHFALDLELHAFAQELITARGEMAKRHKAIGGHCIPLGLTQCEVACEMENGLEAP